VIDWLEQNAADDLQDVTADQLQHYTGLVTWYVRRNRLFAFLCKLRSDKSYLFHPKRDHWMPISQLLVIPKRVIGNCF